MHPLDQGASPSELQASILKGLLSSQRRETFSAVDMDLLSKELAAPVLAAFVTYSNDAKLASVGQRADSIGDLLKGLAPGSVIIVFSNGDTEAQLCLAVLPLTLLSCLLSLALGGKPVCEPVNRLMQPSRTERRFAERLAPSIGLAVRTFLKDEPKNVLVFSLADKDAAAQIAASKVHVLDYQLQLFGQSHHVCIAILQNAVAAKAGDQRKTPVRREPPSKVADEIGRTLVNLDVMMRLADQTLARLQSLMPGDVLGLTPASLTEARLLVRGHELFAGQIGKSGQNFCLRVSHASRNKADALSHMVRTLTQKGEPV
jgi:hypothetical protein